MYIPDSLPVDEVDQHLAISSFPMLVIKTEVKSASVGIRRRLTGWR